MPDDHFHQSLNVSQMLGSISSDIKHLVKQQDITNDKIDALQETSVEQRLSTKSAHKRLDVITKELDEEVKPKVDNHEALKNKGFGVMAVVGIVFGFLGDYIHGLLFGGN